MNNNIENTYYHYKGFEFCISIDNTVSAIKKYYAVVDHEVVCDNNIDKLIKKACKVIDAWHKLNKIEISQDYTNYKNNNLIYSNYKYLNNGTKIITPLDKINHDVTVDDYLKNPCKYKFYTSDKIELKILELL